MPSAKLNQIVHIVVGVFTINITPFAEFFIKKSVLLSADIAIFKRHTATLADKLSWEAKKRIDRNIK